MSILIKGMDMPEKIEPELVIEFADGIDGKRYARLHHYRYGGLTDWLEAVPVPPHGRLIDADALDNTLGIDDKDDYVHWTLEAAPTVIPASEEGE